MYAYYYAINSECKRNYKNNEKVKKSKSLRFKYIFHLFQEVFVHIKLIYAKYKVYANT